MKKLISLAIAFLMVVSCFAFAGCASKEDSNVIKIGMQGPYTGATAAYGLAVQHGARLYVDEINKAGGINGKQVELIYYDNKGDDAEAINSFNRLVDEGITAFIGDVLTGNTLAVVAEAYPINMPMITASATAAEVTVNPADGSVYTNVFRSCFIDPFQGMTMANYAAEKLGAKTAAVLSLTGDPYSAGCANAFIESCAEVGIEIVAEEGYAAGDKDFNAQLTNIMGKNPDIIFCPNYYEDDGMIVTQARQLGVTSRFVGCDGWGGVKDYASAEDLEGSIYCSGYAPASSDIVKAFEAAYEAAYSEKVPNMFAPLAYDAAMLLCAAIEKAEESGAKVGSDEYKQAIIDAMRTEGASVPSVTSGNGYAFDENNNPIKAANIMELVGGEEVLKEIY